MKLVLLFSVVSSTHYSQNGDLVITPGWNIGTMSSLPGGI